MEQTDMLCQSVSLSQRLKFEKSWMANTQWWRRYSFHYHQTICNNDEW